MKSVESQRILNAIVFIIFLLVASAIHSIPTLRFSDNENITVFNQYIHRFEEIKTMLPLDHPVGYLTDENTATTLSDPRALQRYYLTQYAIAPAILHNSINEEYILGNFFEPINENYIRDNHLTIVKQFANGVVLLKQVKHD